MQLIVVGKSNDNAVFHTFALPCKGVLQKMRMTVESRADAGFYYFGKDLTIGTGLFPLAHEEEGFVPDLNRNGILISNVSIQDVFHTKFKSSKIFFNKGERVALIMEKDATLEFFLIVAEFIPNTGEVIKTRVKRSITANPVFNKALFSIDILTNGWLKSMSMKFLGEEQSDDIGIIWAVLFSANFALDEVLHSSFAQISGEGTDLTPTTAAQISGAEHLDSLPFAFALGVPEIFEGEKEWHRHAGGGAPRLMAGDWIGILQEAIQGSAGSITFIMEIEYYVSKVFPKYIGDWISGTDYLDLNKRELFRNI